MLKKSDILALIEALPEEFDSDTLWRTCSHAVNPDGEWVSPDCTLTKEERDSVVAAHEEAQLGAKIDADKFLERAAGWQDTLESQSKRQPTS